MVTVKCTCNDGQNLKQKVTPFKILDVFSGKDFTFQ